MQNKQVEEMAKVMHDKSREIAKNPCGMALLLEQGKTFPDAYAEALYNANCRILYEDSVVLSKEELQENYVSKTLYTQLQEVSLGRKEQIDKLSQKLGQARQETIEKDFKTVIEALEEIKGQVKSFYGINESVGVDIAIRTVKQIAKDMVVENLC